MRDGDVVFVCVVYIHLIRLADPHATFSLCSLSLQALIAYLLTALSVLGVSKKYCQKGADALLKSRAKKNDTRVPHDVLRREAVLDEHAITRRNGGRRISTVLQLDGDLNISGGGVKRYKQDQETEIIEPWLRVKKANGAMKILEALQ